MELNVYNGEYFERGKTWYIIFAFTILLVAILSILSRNAFGGIFVLIVAGAYIFYTTKTNDTTKLIIGENGLQINKSSILRKDLNGFLLEYNTKKEKIHNIVIITKKNESQIYTIKDIQKNLENFVNQLSEHIPMLEKYDQSTFDKFIRKLKL